MIDSSNSFSPLPPAGTSAKHSVFQTLSFWVLLTLCAILYLPSLFWALGLDQNIFAEIGSLILSGKKPYVDAWDVKPPNIFYTYALLEWIFGQNDFAIRLSDYLSMLAACAVMYLWIDRRVRSFPFAYWTPVVASLLLVLTLLSLGLADTAQTESYSLVFLLLAAHSAGRRQSMSHLAVGIAIGIATFYKTTNAIFLLPIIIELLIVRPRTEWLRKLGFVLAGFLLVIGVELGSLALQGNLQEYLTITLNVARAHPEEVSNLRFFDLLRAIWVLVDIWSVIALAGIICALLKRDMLLMRALRLPLFYLAAGLIAVYLQNKGWGYHYVILLPGLIGVCAIASLYLFQRLRVLSRYFSFALAFIAVVITITISPSARRRLHYTRDAVASVRSHASYLGSLGTYRSLYYPPCTEELARYLQTHSSANDQVFIFGEEPGVYWKSDRQPTSCYIYSLLFTSGVISSQDLQAMSDTLASRKPFLFVVERFDTLRFRNKPETSESLLRDDSNFRPLNLMLRSDYKLSDTVCGKFLVYKRQ